MAKQTEKARERYFVIEEGETWNPLGDHIFSDLKKASDYFFEWSDQESHVIAKEIGIERELDEKNLKYRIKPVGDFKSKLPYYHIYKYSNGRGFEVETFRKMSELARLGMPNEDEGIYIARGLEVKLED